MHPYPLDQVLWKDTPQASSWYKVGLQAISQGRVGVILLAGGHGTRLGSSLPKGQFDLKLPSGKTLYQLYAERILKLELMTNSSIPWYIMTSSATSDFTVEFFKKNNYFSLSPSNVIFFRQDDLPGLTEKGEPIKDVSVPNGNGGMFLSLKKHGLLQNMKKRGVDILFVSSVDNILCQVADPTFIGAFICRNAECGLKVVTKKSPDECLGVVVLDSAGKVRIVEYSELSSDMKKENYTLGNICIHLFTRDFLEFASSIELPYHFARKKLVDGFGKTQDITGIKREQFIFDIFPFASSVLVFGVNREEEFAPLKNATGPDSPETCRQAFSSLCISWLERSGAKVLRSTPFDLVEISPLLSSDGTHLKQIVKGKTFQAPCYLGTLPLDP